MNEVGDCVVNKQWKRIEYVCFNIQRRLNHTSLPPVTSLPLILPPASVSSAVSSSAPLASFESSQTSQPW